MRLIVAIAGASILQGCCCCPFGGGGGNRSSSSPVEEWAAEELTEALIEKASGEGVEVEFESDKGFTITTEDGELSTFADGNIPDGFPLPILDGARITAATRLTPTGAAPTWTVIMTTDQPPAEAMAWYEKQAEAKGYTVTTIAELVAATGHPEADLPIQDKGMITLTKDDMAGSVFASPGDDGTEVMIMLGPPEAP